MKNMTLQNIANACGGQYHGSDEAYLKEVEGVALDSRIIEEKWLFVATKGNNHDGHDYIPEVMEKGALCAVSEKELELEEWYQGTPYILVKSSFAALRDIAEYYLAQLFVKVVGITGSVGKTSTKEMIAGVLSEKYHVLKTQGNYNNEVGLPLTIFRLRPEDEVAVLEMGISDFGEMTRLSKIAKPDIAVITNIGQCHLEQLENRDGVLKAKTEIFANMKPDGFVVLNGDDDKLASVKEVHGKSPYFFHKTECEAWTVQESECKDPKRIVYADCVKSYGLKGTRCRIHFFEESFEAYLSVPGVHQVYNALAAAMVGKLLGLNKEEIKAGMEKVLPLDGRTKLIQTKDYLFVDDCYNANPVSMKAAITLMETALTRTVAILGDMFELGKDSEKLHYDTGVFAGESGLSVICAVGTLAKHLYEGALSKKRENCRIYYFADKEELYAQLSTILQKGDTILVKASHGMEFEEILKRYAQ